MLISRTKPDPNATTVVKFSVHFRRSQEQSLTLVRAPMNQSQEHQRTIKKIN